MLTLRIRISCAQMLGESKPTVADGIEAVAGREVGGWIAIVNGSVVVGEIVVVCVGAAVGAVVVGGGVAAGPRRVETRT